MRRGSSISSASSGPISLSQRQSNSLPFLSTRGGGSLNNTPRGGVRYAEPSDDDLPAAEGVVAKTLSAFGSMWGSMGVVYILVKAIKRVLPIAIEPLKSGSSLALSKIQWGLYAATCLFFAYAEGYKGFQLKFSPLVVKRSATLVPGTKQGNNPLNYLLAPLYSMGLINATKKRLIVSWSVSMGVAMIVALVKRLPPISRCIMDAGVVVGLTWGSLSIQLFYLRTLFTGKTPDVDACLP
ncbi:unnamed protein product [Cylindrotheca closterium]|uniref:Uncharacterized protein n=1 Tax=Cylindrotheca closterium TaxID=2856 RepID=A0AAD2CCP9_9STRA|nr:unnamed protein product [Cylindrotheca closterium]